MNVQVKAIYHSLGWRPKRQIKSYELIKASDTLWIDFKYIARNKTSVKYNQNIILDADIR